MPAAVIPSFSQFYASQLLDNRSNLTGKDLQKYLAHVYLAAMKSGTWKSLRIAGCTTLSSICTDVSGACVVIPRRSALGLL